MLDFAVKVANGAHEMTAADIETMRDERWSDEEIMHVIEIASMFSFTGRLANAFGRSPTGSTPIWAVTRDRNDLRPTTRSGH